MAASRLSSGIFPASESFEALTIIMKRIGRSPVSVGSQGLYLHDE